MLKEPRKIIVTDDDEDDREFFKGAIDCITSNAEVLPLNDGVFLSQFLNNQSNQVPDIIFLDINMPRKDGFECLEEIRSKYSATELPVIMYSTSESEHDILHSKKLGANLYVKKPTDFSTLKTLLSKVLEIDWSKTDPLDREFFINN
jgi:DNA-binding response OmpR family regulator